MGVIRILDEAVSNIIAAGEVVESPTSLVKELLENSIDAKSKRVYIEIKDGGRYIRIKDDGKGMEKDDLLICVERHATSKIREKEDLFNLSTYGFRGEALSSICAVSKVKITSKVESDSIGNIITVLGSKVTSFKEGGSERGTEIEIKELFFNTPARLKFLRKAFTEYSSIKEIVFQEALGNPDIAISLEIDGKVVISTSGNGMDNAIIEIFGVNILKNLIPFELGFLGNSTISRATKDSIYIFVNGRVVKSKIIEDAIIDSYYTKLSKGKYPFAIIFINLHGKDVDVNVHPSKKIVKFSNDTNIYNTVVEKISEVMAGADTLTARELNVEIQTPIKTFESLPIKEQIEIGHTFKVEPTSTVIPVVREEVIARVVDENRSVKILKEKNLENIVIENKNLEEKNLETKKSEDKILENIDSKNKKLVDEIKEDKIKDEKISEDKILESGDSLLEKNIKSSELEIKEELCRKPKLEIREELEIKEEVPEKFKVIGQFMNSYIIVERNNTLELYDQHIVHERILYEKYKNEYLSKSIKSQGLLIPERVTLEPKDLDRVVENREILESFGFEIEEFGKNEILIRSVPLFGLKDSVESLFRELLNELTQYKTKDPRESIIITMSCKGAIKAGEPLKNSDMESLIQDLHKIGEYTCPHGRPIILRLDINEIEKKFKRK